MKDWKPLDWVIIALTVLIVVTIGGSWLIGVAKELQLDEIRLKIIDSIYSSVMSVIALYIGAKIQQNKDRK